MTQTQQLVLVYHDKITTTSMKVAEAFDKEHKNVLRDIETLECSEEFSRLNFELSKRTVRGKDYPFYFITRDGFSFLAMGYTGARAAQFKEEFIKAFNRMEHALFKATTPSLVPTYSKRILSLAAKNCPSNRWCIFDQANEIMLLIEKEVGSVSEYDLVDGSIGQYWSKFRAGMPWAKTVSQYWYEFNDKRGNQLAACYEYLELEHFKVWLKNVYRVEHLPDYLYNKYKKDPLMLPRVQAFTPKLLGKPQK